MIEKFLQAVKLSELAHRGQVRRGTSIEYFSHPLAVAADILGRGGSYEQAMAGLCHDILEDCGPEFEEDIRALGEDVLTMVLDASDCVKGRGPKKNWYARKFDYLIDFQEKDPRSFLVVLCDKLHNSNATVHDSLQAENGFIALEKFRAPPGMVVWYFVALFCQLQKGAQKGYLPMSHVNDLRLNVDHMIGLLQQGPGWNEIETYHATYKEYNSLKVMLHSGDPFVCPVYW